MDYEKARLFEDQLTKMEASGFHPAIRLIGFQDGIQDGEFFTVN